MRLVSSHGSVDVNIFLLARENETGTPRTRILVGSYNGSIVAGLESSLADVAFLLVLILARAASPCIKHERKSSVPLPRHFDQQ